MKKIFGLFFLALLVQPLTAGNGHKDKKAAKNQDTAVSQDTLSVQQIMARLQDTLKFQPAGTKADLGGLATLTVPAGFKYLEPGLSEYVLTKLWSNPPGESSLGMLFPEHALPLDSDCWAIDITFSNEGFVKDDDASDMNFDEMLKSLKTTNDSASKERIKGGFGRLELQDWAEKPHYDSKTHKLYWALNFKTDEDINTLNYNIRILGRKGYLNMNAIGKMNQLKAISERVNPVLASVDFNSGQRYSDFDPSIDKVAVYGVGALVAGKLLLKVGFFAKFWKVIMLGLVAIGGFFRRLFTGRKKNDPPAASPMLPGNPS